MRGEVQEVQGEMCYGFDASEVPPILVEETAGGDRVRRETKCRCGAGVRAACWPSPPPAQHSINIILAPTPC